MKSLEQEAGGSVGILMRGISLELDKKRIAMSCLIPAKRTLGDKRLFHLKEYSLFLLSFYVHVLFYTLHS